MREENDFMKYDLLAISPYAPYDSVGHAGGKIHNYYLKKFNADGAFNVKLLTFAKISEKEKIDLKSYNVENEIFYMNMSFIARLKRLAFYNINMKFNPFDKNGGYIDYYQKAKVIKYLRKLKGEGYNPQIIVLTWTQMVLMIADIKKIFPLSKYVAIEHDVACLALYRKYLIATNIIIRCFRKIKYEKLKKAEIQRLKKFDYVMTYNKKDLNLLLEEKLNNFSKVDYISPYFSNMSYINSKLNEKNIIFFGAMDRVENYESCIWFIQNVFYELLKIDKSFKFFIIGNKPNIKLYKYSNKNIVITGFVDDTSEYFNKALCMVAPLVLGAGIKIKILEGMSAGIPVLTNEIGIEGIPAAKNDFIYCTHKEDYINSIMLLSNNTAVAKEIGNNAKKFIKEKFDLSRSYEKYKKNILELVQ